MKTYGTVTLKKGHWVVECEPHVAIRLKRVFSKLAKSDHGKIRISDTPENCRDLEWFAERYPLAFEPSEHLQGQASGHRERQSLVEDLLACRAPSPAFELALPAREYQRQAAALWLATGGLLLADDLGLGKSCSAIAGLTDPRTLPALVVCLTHLPRQWQSEIAKFAPQLKTHIVVKGTPYDLAANLCRGPKGTGIARPHVAVPVQGGFSMCLRCRARGIDLESRLPDVIICNYHKLSGWAETLSPLVRSVIFDEVQELRHKRNGGTDSAKYRAAQHIADHAGFRAGLSATPFYNYGGEMFNVLEIVKPSAMGTREEFMREWCGGYSGADDKARIKDPKAFGTYLRDEGLMLRRTRSEVGRELPALQVVPHYVEADAGVLERADEAASLLARKILASDTEKEVRFRASGEFDMMMRKATGLAKAPYVAEFVRLLVDSGERVVLYGWHRDVYSVWLDRLKELKPVLYTGTESVNQKDEAKRKFITGETPVIIISLRSGAGLDGLQQVCRTVVFGELDWSPGVHEQCTGRVYRDGQGDPVVAYYLLAEDGSDPVIADVLGVKRQQIEGVRDATDELVERLEVDPHHVRRLAEAYLQRKGVVMEPEREEAIA